MYLSVKIRLKLIICAAVVLIIFTAAGAAAVSQNDEKKHEGVFVPIIMYHNILKDESLTGDYTVTPLQLERDFIYLKQEGYTPIFLNDLIRYVRYGGDLPEKPVVLTFDDGAYNNYTYLYPLLKKYDFKAAISVVGSYTVEASESAQEQNAAYSYLSWKNINEMRESGLVEFCNHSYNFHSYDNRRGVCRKSDEAYEQYRSVFLNDVVGLQQLFEENCGFRPNVFTYPYGFCDESSMRLVKNIDFEASLGVEEKPNYIIKGENDCLYNLNRYNRSGFYDTESFMQRALSE